LGSVLLAMRPVMNWKVLNERMYLRVRARVRVRVRVRVMVGVCLLDG
jgi:hypothetical protein